VTDQEIVLKAIADMQKISDGYSQPGLRDAEFALQKIIEILNRRDVVAAAERLARGIRIVK
jgi:hypothetical protein